MISHNHRQPTVQQTLCRHNARRVTWANAGEHSARWRIDDAYRLPPTAYRPAIRADTGRHGRRRLSCGGLGGSGVGRSAGARRSVGRGAANARDRGR
jgi:hypothetical protein